MAQPFSGSHEICQWAIGRHNDGISILQGRMTKGLKRHDDYEAVDGRQGTKGDDCPFQNGQALQLMKAFRCVPATCAYSPPMRPAANKIASAPPTISALHFPFDRRSPLWLFCCD